MNHNIVVVDVQRLLCEKELNHNIVVVIDQLLLCKKELNHNICSCCYSSAVTV